MAVTKLGSTHPLSWFKERVGKKVRASSSTYNGEFIIEDESHASYLCNVSQPNFHFRFSDPYNSNIKSNESN